MNTGCRIQLSMLIRTLFGYFLKGIVRVGGEVRGRGWMVLDLTIGAKATFFLVTFLIFLFNRNFLL